MADVNTAKATVFLNSMHWKCRLIPDHWSAISELCAIVSASPKFTVFWLWPATSFNFDVGRKLEMFPIGVVCTFHVTLKLEWPKLMRCNTRPSVLWFGPRLPTSLRVLTCCRRPPPLPLQAYCRSSPPAPLPLLEPGAICLGASASREGQFLRGVITQVDGGLVKVRRERWLWLNRVDGVGAVWSLPFVWGTTPTSNNFKSSSGVNLPSKQYWKCCRHSNELNSIKTRKLNEIRYYIALNFSLFHICVC